MAMSFEEFAPKEEKASAGSMSFDEFAPKETEAKGSMTFDEFAPPEAKDTSALAAFGKSTAESTVPTTGGFLGAAAAISNPVGQAAIKAAPGPWSKLAVTAGLGLAGGFPGSIALQKIQEAVKEVVPEALLQSIGFDTKTRAAEQEQHPIASQLGELAPSLAAFRPGSVPMIERLVGAVMGGAIEGGQQVIKGEFDPTRLAVATAFQAGAPKATRLGKALFEPTLSAVKPGTIKPEVKPVVEPEIKPEVEPSTTTTEADTFIRDVQEHAAKKKVEEEKLTTPPKEEPTSTETPGTSEPVTSNKTEYKTRQEQEDRISDLNEIIKFGPDNSHPDPIGAITSAEKEKADLQRSLLPPETRDHFKADIEALKFRAAMRLEEADNLARSDPVAAKVVEKDALELEKRADELRKQMPEAVIKDKALPTHEEVKDVLHEASTLGEALNTIHTSGLGTTAQRLLLRVLRGNKMVESASFKYADYLTDYRGKAVLGLYDPNYHVVGLSNTRPSKAPVQTILHEALHAGVHAALEEGQSAAARGMHRLFAEYKVKYMREHFPEAIEGMTKKEIVDADFSELQAQHNAANPYAAHNLYGLLNVHEFVSEAFTSKSFQAQLRSLKSSQTVGTTVKDMWDAFISHVKDMTIGHTNSPEARTALHDVLEKGSELVESTRTHEQQADGTIKTGPVGSRMSDEVGKSLGEDGIHVAHDSPHRFSQFNWREHFLKGEGVAAKGAGLYFSSADGVHFNYKRNFEKSAKANNPARLKLGNGNVPLNRDNIESHIWLDLKWLERKGLPRKDAIDKLVAQRELEAVAAKESGEGPWAQDQITELTGNKEAWLHATEVPAENKHFGTTPTYHATIKVKSGEMLDWDKPFSEQHPEIQKKLQGVVDGLFPEIVPEGAEWKYINTAKDTNQSSIKSLTPDVILEAKVGDTTYKIAKSTHRGKPEFHLYSSKYSGLVEAYPTLAEAKRGQHDPTGQQLYENLVTEFGPTLGNHKTHGSPKAQIATSDYLQSVGVIGHKFKAEAGKNEKYPNYVIYDDTRVKQNYVAFKAGSMDEPTSGIRSPADIEAKRTKYDPRKVENREDLLNKGAEILAAKGEAAAKEFFEGYQKYKQTWGKPVNEIEDFTEININNKMANERIVSNNKKELEKLVPDPAVREEVALAIDANKVDTLTGEARVAAEKYQALMKDVGERALKQGVVKGLLENYVTHIVNWEDLPKGALDTFLNEVFGTKAGGESGTKMSPDSRFGLGRKVSTFADLEKVLGFINDRIAAAGKEFRLEVKTKDIAEIYNQYALSMEKAIENKKLVEGIMTVRNVNGVTMVRRVTAEEPMPYGWEMIKDRQFAGFAVHPDVAPALKFAFEAKGGAAINALYTVSQAVKRINVMGSAFHAKSLIEVLSSTGIPIYTPIKEIGLGIVDALAKTKLSGITKALDAFKAGGVGDSVDQWIKKGLVLEMPQDVTTGLLTSAGKFADSVIAKYGPKTRVLESSLGTVEKYTLGLFDNITWNYLHTGGKLYTAEKYLERARLDASKRGTAFDEDAARTEIVSFINKSFGGLNWFQEARAAQTELGKRIAMAAYSPEGRKGMQVMLFAPDWTISTIKAFTAALPESFNPAKMHPVEGVKGMLHPVTKNDYARLYQFKTVVTYLTLLNGINMLTANRPIWENKDPTRIEWPDGTSMQAMKHAMEPYHWIVDPDKTLTNKLGFIPKATVTMLTGLEYASPYAPKLVDPSVTNRALAVAKEALPFQASAALTSPEGEGTKRAVLGTLGFPVYGKTKQQKNMENKARYKAQSDARRKWRMEQAERN